MIQSESRCFGIITTNGANLQFDGEQRLTLMMGKMEETSDDEFSSLMYKAASFSFYPLGKNGDTTVLVDNIKLLNLVNNVPDHVMPKLKEFTKRLAAKVVMLAIQEISVVMNGAQNEPSLTEFIEVCVSNKCMISGFAKVGPDNIMNLIDPNLFIQSIEPVSNISRLNEVGVQSYFANTNKAVALN